MHLNHCTDSLLEGSDYNTRWWVCRQKTSNNYSCHHPTAAPSSVTQSLIVMLHWWFLLLPPAFCSQRLYWTALIPDMAE